MSNKPVNKATTDTGAVASDVVRHSQDQVHGTGNIAGSVELAMALGESQELVKKQAEEIKALRAQLSDGNKSSDNDIAKLVKALTDLAAKPTKEGPTEADEVNRSIDFNTQRTTIDGRSLLEAQAAVNSFRREPKVPISIPKSLANTFGPYIAISVNGVRIAVNCDGRTYMINKTHAEHIKERIAKVDAYNAKPGEDITINA